MSIIHSCNKIFSPISFSQEFVNLNIPANFEQSLHKRRNIFFSPEKTSKTFAVNVVAYWKNQKEQSLQSFNFLKWKEFLAEKFSVFAEKEYNLQFLPRVLPRLLMEVLMNNTWHYDDDYSVCKEG